MNDWDRIRAFYRRHHVAIMANPTFWGMDVYAWDHEAGIRLTPIESALWADIRLLSAVLYPQYPVGRRFVDFGNPHAKVAIECDGAAFHTDAAADRQRQAEIESLGWTVYRFTGRECFTDEHDVETEQGNTRLVQGDALIRLRGIVDRHGMREGGR